MPHGKICYLEIPANRAEDSTRFYSDILGWTVRERGLFGLYEEPKR